ncbi:DUF4023 domain-containing protein [Paenibacillus sepulcri]|uniref:DUF4023 domain-containing protein n=1 Tax=Paenibacillus sepulcri TaxID=359917 RepID=A0ABS7C1F8_9BACL|nr:DUF4023 domain-containing protein [Paenibacillus sepulcri]
MESTNEFVNKVKDTQSKQQKNKEHNGKGKPSQKLQNVQHTNNP